MISTFLGGLEAVFGWLLEASWQASVLAILVLCLQWLLSEKLNPRWHHALWLLVVARLLLPALPESALSLFQFASKAPLAITQTVTAPIFAAPSEVLPEMPSISVEPARYPLSAFTVLALIWLVGALGLLLLTWRVNRRFARHVAAARPANEPRLLKLAATAQQELGIQRSLRMIESANVQSPAIMGLFRPTLILPAGVCTRFSDDELRFIFLHEFAHLKRGDLFLQWVIALLQILHWFNPVLWYAFRRARIDREPATDALVLSCTGEACKESYGQVLVKLLEHYHRCHSLPTLVGILEDKDQFKRRFSLIARFTRGAYGWSLLGLLLITALAITGLTESKAIDSAASSPHVWPPADLDKTIGFRALEATGEINPPTDPAVNAAIDNLKLTSLDLPTLPLHLYLDEMAKVLKNQNPDSEQVTFILMCPAEDQPHQVSFRLDHPATLREIMAQLNAQYPLRYQVRGTTDIIVWQVSHFETDFKKQAAKTTIDLNLDHVTLAEALKTVQASAATKGFIFDISNFADARRFPADAPYDITLQQHQISLDEALRYILVTSKMRLVYELYGAGKKYTIVPASSLQDFPMEPIASEAVSQSPDLSAQMLTAVQKGDTAAVQKLVDQGVDPNKVEDQGQPLIFAAGSPAVLEILLQHGANPNARNSQNDAVLCCLLRNKGKQATAIARVLLEHGADPNIRAGELGETPLMDAQDGAAVDLLIQHGGDIHLRMTDGSGVLDMASDHPLDYFQSLLRHGVPFDVKKDGPTLLLRASWISNLPIMKEMIDRGVDPNVEGVWAMVNGKPDLMLPIRAAAVDNQPEAAKFLLAHGAKADDAMNTALYNRNEKIVKLFWESGVRNISELCYQISQGAPTSDLAKLLDAGVAADPPEDTKITPLGEAAQLGNMEAVKLLIAHKAEVNARGQFDPKRPKGWEMTPLCLAAAEGQDEVVAYLLQHGAIPDPAAVYQAGFNSYPYSEQRSKDHFEKTVRILIDAGALKNITPDMAGLVLAGPLGTRQGPPNPTVLKMILDAGVSPESPMPYLAENGEKPNTVIGYYREYYQKRKDDTTYAASAATIKPMLDMLEAADKGAASKSDATVSVPPAVTDANQQAQTYIEVNYVETANTSAMPGGMTTTTEAAKPLVQNPKNKHVLLNDFPLQPGMNTLKGKTPWGSDFTVTLNWSNTLANKAQDLSLKMEWLHANGGDVSYGSEFKASLRSDECFVVTGPWKTKETSNLLISFVNHPSEQPQKTDAGSAPDEAAFYQALERDRTLMADSSVTSSTLAADAQMLRAIQKGDFATLKKVLEHAVDPNTFDPDRFYSCPVYWAVHFNQPEILKLLLEHFATGDIGPAHETPLQLAQRTHPNLVPIIEEGIKRNRALLTARLTEKLHSIHIDLPGFSGAPLSQMTKFLLDDATAKAGYLDRRVNIGTMDLPPSTTITSPARPNISVWDALQTIADANKLKFDVDGSWPGNITLYPPRDETVIHPPATGSTTNSAAKSPDARANPMAASTNETLAQLVLALHDTSPAIAPVADRAKIIQKLQTIVFDKVDFKHQDIADVIQQLVQKSKYLDPEKVGVPFVLCLDSGSGGTSALKPDPQIHREVTLHMHNATLAEIVGNIVQQTKLTYALEDYAVYLRPPSVDENTLTVRTFLVPANFLIITLPASGDSTSVDGKQSVVINRLENLDIKFPSGASATYLPDLNKLIVRNTPGQLDKIAALIETFTNTSALKTEGNDVPFDPASTFVAGGGLNKPITLSIVKPMPDRYGWAQHMSR